MNTPNANQINSSILGMSSAVFTSLAATVVTFAIKSNVLVDKSFNVAIHGVSAAEFIAEAGEKRAEIYGQGIVNNGALAERETTLKQKLRLHALEKQEKAAKASLKPVKAKPASRRKYTSTSKQKKKTTARKAA